MAEVPHNDICLVRGETLKVDLPIADRIRMESLPCDLQLALRISRRGRLFLSIDADNIDYRFSEDEGVVTVFSNAADFADVPAITYVYDLYAQCADKKVVVSRGFFELQPNANTDHDLEDCGDLPVPPVQIDGPPTISATSDPLQICCCKSNGVPLYFEINDPDGVEDAWIDAEWGRWTVEARYKGTWVADPAFVLLSTRYRLGFVRFDKYHPDIPAHEREWWQGGVETCTSCPEPPCEDFSITVNAEDTFGNKAQEVFDITVIEEGKTN